MRNRSRLAHLRRQSYCRLLGEWMVGAKEPDRKGSYCETNSIAPRNRPQVRRASPRPVAGRRSSGSTIHRTHDRGKSFDRSLTVDARHVDGYKFLSKPRLCLLILVIENLNVC